MHCGTFPQGADRKNGHDTRLCRFSGDHILVKCFIIINEIKNEGGQPYERVIQFRTQNIARIYFPE